MFNLWQQNILCICDHLCAFVCLRSGNSLAFLMSTTLLLNLMQWSALCSFPRSAWPEPECVFGDVRQLPAAAWCYKQGKLIKLSSIDLLIMGFPCIDLSVLKEKKIPFQVGCGSVSADVFHTLPSIVKAWQPQHILLENVAGATGSCRSCALSCHCTNCSSQTGVRFCGTLGEYT